MILLTPSSALPYSYGVFGAYFLRHSPFNGITSVSATGVIANVSMITFDIYNYANVR